MKKSLPLAQITRMSQRGKHLRVLFAICCAACSSASHAAPVAITGPGSYAQNFDTLPGSGSAAWVDDGTLPGWYSQRTGSGTTIEADTGSNNDGNLYSYGAASTAERALGSVGTSNATAENFAHGVQLHNTSGAAATLNSLAYTGEQWRKSGEIAAQVVTLRYKLSSSQITLLNPETSNTGWTAIPLGDFSSPINTVGSGALDGNNPAHRTAISINPNIIVPAGDYLMVRWKDPDQTGVDHGLAIDDLALSWIATPPSSLNAGSIAFVGFNADGDDDLAFVALAAIPENEVIRFTDNEWNGSPLGSGGALVDSNEGIITWTAPIGGVAAGQVVTLGSLATPAPVASAGTLTRSGGFDLLTTDETVYAYQGTPLTPTGFLAVIATHNGDSTVGTGLGSAHIIYLPNDKDVAAYTGSRTSQTSFAAYLALLGNTVTNWITEDGSGDQHTNGIAPDVPFASTAFTLTASGNTFASWLAANAPGENASQDHDNDGIPNGTEYFMGSAGNAFTPNPGPISGAVTWPRAAGTTITSFKVEISTGLTAWEDASILYAANLNISASQVIFTLPSSLGRIFIRLNVTP